MVSALLTIIVVVLGMSCRSRCQVMIAKGRGGDHERQSLRWRRDDDAHVSRVGDAGSSGSHLNG